MRFRVASLYIEDRTDTDMKLRNCISENTWFIADYQHPIRERVVGIYKSSYSGSTYMSDSGQVCSYETFADPYKITFHI